MRSLIAKLMEEEEVEGRGGDGGVPLLVRAAVDPAGHQLLVWLLRDWDRLPSKPQLETVLLTHLHQIKQDPIGCLVIQAYAGSL